MSQIILLSIIQYWTLCLFRLDSITGNSLNGSENSLYWEPVKPLLFNKDVILKCHIKDCCPDGTQWTGGKTNSLLTLGRVSNNKAKYEESWGVDASYLKIKKFGMEDGDSLYTCFHGFLKYTRNLTIKGNNFALMPTEETLKKNFAVRNGYLNASVEFLKVYPKPVCNCTFQNLRITEHINISGNFYPSANIFLNGKLDIRHQICNEDCLGTIQIDCRIGTHELKAIVDIQFLQSLKKSNDNEFSTTDIICVVLSVVAVLLLVAIAVYFSRRNCKKACCRFMKGSSIEMCCLVENNPKSKPLSIIVPCEPSENAGNNGGVEKDPEVGSLLSEKHVTADDLTEKTQLSSVNK